MPCGSRVVLRSVLQSVQTGRTKSSGSSGCLPLPPLSRAWVTIKQQSPVAKAQHNIHGGCKPEDTEYLDRASSWHNHLSLSKVASNPFLRSGHSTLKQSATDHANQAYCMALPLAGLRRETVEQVESCSKTAAMVFYPPFANWWLLACLYPCLELLWQNLLLAPAHPHKDNGYHATLYRIPAF